MEEYIDDVSCSGVTLTRRGGRSERILILKKKKRDESGEHKEVFAVKDH